MIPRPFRFSVTASGVNDPAALADLARRCEDLGYDTLAIADHLDDQLAPLVALGHVCANTSSLTLLTLVLANDFRHPAVLAKEIASLDLISGGRVELGLGAGWMLSDYQQTGIEQWSAEHRIERLEESIEIIRGLFSTEPVHFHGEHYRIDGLVGTPPPVQGSHLPLLVAGGRPKVLGVAARHADIIGLNPSLRAGVIDERIGASATAEATDEKLGWIRAAAGDRFDDIELHTRVHVAAITDDRQSMAEALAPTLGVTPDEALASPHALAGTPDQCVETILGWRERWGISYIGFSASVVDAMAPVVDRLRSLGQ